MRTSLVNHAAGVIQRAMQRCDTAAGVAIALDSAQMLQDPQTAAEHERRRLALSEACDQIAELEARVADLEVERAKLVRWHNEDARENERLRARVAERGGR